MKGEITVLPLLFLFSGGVVLLVYGILVRVGRLKYWWASPYYAAGQEPFVSLPAATFFLSLSVAVVSPTQMKQSFVLLAIGCGLSALVFLLIRPRFLKPAWLQWLEANHKKNISLLRREARKMGAFQWAKRMRTQADLEQWVQEVLRKHGLIP